MLRRHRGSGSGTAGVGPRVQADLQETHKEVFPQDPHRQLHLAIEAVFRSWNSPRAVRYREINHLHGHLGTAVTVQAMVFGNLDDDSGTGVCFTRNPATGEDKLFGEFLVNAQGEDVVAGIRTPRDVQEMKDWNPKVLEELLEMKWVLEGHFKDMQDLEFTIERGDLFMLQSRRGQRTGAAAVRIAVDMVDQGIINQEEALLRIPPQAMTQFLLPGYSAEDKAGTTVLTTGTSGLARGGPGEAGVYGGGGGATDRRRGGCDSGSTGNLSGGRGRNAPRCGDPHLHRWDDLPRRSGGPGLGKVLCGGGR